MSTETVVSIVLIGVFLLLSAFFSSSEAAFLSLQRTRLNYLVTNNIPGAKRVHDMVTNTERLLSTILLGNNLVNVAFTAVVTALAVKWLKEGPVAVAAATIVGTGLLLIFGEIIPKSYAIRNPESWSIKIARMVDFFGSMFSPVVLVFIRLAQIITREDSEVAISSPYVTRDEIQDLLEVGKVEGVIEEEELAQNLTEGDVENLKTQIRTRIEVENEANERDRRVFTAIQRITEKKPFELPVALVQEETDALVRAQARNLQEQEGLSEEDAKAKAEESRAQASPEAKRRLQHHFVLNAIARQETIQVSPTELDSALKAIGERHGVPPADVRKAYEERGMLRELEGEILEAKARSFVAQKITPTEESPEVATAASDE